MLYTCYIHVHIFLHTHGTRMCVCVCVQYIGIPGLIISVLPTFASKSILSFLPVKKARSEPMGPTASVGAALNSSRSREDEVLTAFGLAGPSSSSFSSRSFALAA